MKKLFIAMLLAGFVGVTAQAQGVGTTNLENWDTKTFGNKAASAKVNQAVLIKQIQADKQQANTKEKVNALSQKVIKALDLLQSNNQKYKTEIISVVKEYKGLLDANTFTGTEDQVAQNFYLAQGYLQESVQALTAKNAKLGETVNEIVDHPYWVEYKQQTMSMKQIILWAHEMFPSLPWTNNELK